MYKLRDYQAKAVQTALESFKTQKNPFIVQAATGAGKSLIIADICHQLNEPILVLQPSKEILEQNYKKLVSYDPMIDAGIYSASKGKKEIRKFTFATIGSIYRKPEEFKHFKYVIIDECHGVNPKEQDTMLLSFLNAIDCKHVLGLTATPYRIAPLWTRDKYGTLYAEASLKMINRIGRTPFFRKIVFSIETEELIKQGYLSPIKYFGEKVDLDELVVNSTGRDFTADSMKKYWNQKRLSRIAAAIEYSHQNNQRTLVFCSTIQQAEAVQKMVAGLDIKAMLVTGKTPDAEREAKIAWFKSGKYPVMLNVGVFTTGFDVPELDCIVLARPTMSLALYYQMVGRGVRIDPERPDKVLQVYDLVGVVERLGRVETIKIKKEKNGFRDEVWSEVGRMDNVKLYSFKVKPKRK